MNGAALFVTAFALLACDDGTPTRPAPWGSDGHEMAARAAVETLPSDMPSFFRASADQPYLVHGRGRDGHCQPQERNHNSPHPDFPMVSI